MQQKNNKELTEKKNSEQKFKKNLDVEFKNKNKNKNSTQNFNQQEKGKEKKEVKLNPLNQKFTNKNLQPNKQDNKQHIQQDYKHYVKQDNKQYVKHYNQGENKPQNKPDNKQHNIHHFEQNKFNFRKKKVFSKRTRRLKFLLKKRRIRSKNIVTSSVKRNIIGSIKLGSKYKFRGKKENFLFLSKLKKGRKTIKSYRKAVKEFLTISNNKISKLRNSAFRKKHLVTRFSKKRKLKNSNFVYSLVHSGFLQRQDDLRPDVFNFYKPYLSSLLLKQLFSILFQAVSRRKRRLYGFTEDKKLLQFLAVLSSHGKISRFFKVGGSTNLSNWSLSSKKGRVLLLINSFFNSNLLNVVLKRKFNLSYNVIAESSSLRQLPSGSYFLANDAAEDFNKSVFLTQFVNKSAHLFLEKRKRFRKKFFWLKKQKRRLSRKPYFPKKYAKFAHRLFFFRKELTLFRKLRNRKLKKSKKSIKKAIFRKSKFPKSFKPGIIFKKNFNSKTLIKSYLPVSLEKSFNKMSKEELISRDIIRQIKFFRLRKRKQKRLKKQTRKQREMELRRRSKRLRKKLIVFKKANKKVIKKKSSPRVFITSFFKRKKTENANKNKKHNKNKSNLNFEKKQNNFYNIKLQIIKK